MLACGQSAREHEQLAAAATAPGGGDAQLRAAARRVEGAQAHVAWLRSLAGGHQ